MLFKMGLKTMLNEPSGFSGGAAEFLQTGMDLIADLDTQLLNTFVFVLKKLKGLLPLIFNEDVLYSGNEVKIGNVDGVTKIVLLIDVTQRGCN